MLFAKISKHLTLSFALVSIEVNSADIAPGPRQGNMHMPSFEILRAPKNNKMFF